MSTMTTSKEILKMLDRVIESKTTTEQLNQEARDANREYRKLLKNVGKNIENRASHSDEIADRFFTEEGVLYKGQLFLFDDEGTLIVSMGPQVIEVV